MITIEQLLESVYLDFEPRWVTEDENGAIWVHSLKPIILDGLWQITKPVGKAQFIGYINLSEFSDKDWQECIYEVPQNDVDYEKIKLDMEETSKQLDKISAQLDTIRELMAKRGLIKVEAVNELKGANQ